MTEKKEVLRICHICGQAISLENCGSDEQSQPVHEGCYAEQIANEKRDDAKRFA